jgi:hypothetical protein
MDLGEAGVGTACIDILTSLSGVEFSDYFPLHIAAENDGVLANFMDLENLNKKAAGRHQDLADVENLKDPRERVLFFMRAFMILFPHGPW